MSRAPNYDEMYLAKYKTPVPASQREALEQLWDALLNDAIEQISIAKDELVHAGRYEHAAVARDLADVLREMRSAEPRERKIRTRTPRPTGAQEESDDSRDA